MCVITPKFRTPWVYTKAALNIVLSVVLCILFTALGVAMARRL